MKKKRFTEEQIAYALAQKSTGQTIAEICRNLDVSEQTFYQWKKKKKTFGAIGVAEVRRLKQLEVSWEGGGSCGFLYRPLLSFEHMTVTKQHLPLR